MLCLNKLGNNSRKNLMNGMRPEGFLDVAGEGLLVDVVGLEGDVVVEEEGREEDEVGEVEGVEIGVVVGREGGEGEVDCSGLHSSNTAYYLYRFLEPVSCVRKGEHYSDLRSMSRWIMSIELDTNFRTVIYPLLIFQSRVQLSFQCGGKMERSLGQKSAFMHLLWILHYMH
jgi:hypothetical protein